MHDPAGFILFFLFLAEPVSAKCAEIFNPVNADGHDSAGLCLGEQDAHKGAGDAHLLCDLVLGHILLVIQAGNIYHSLDLLLWGGS